ncbi:hypothetical protein HMPREF3033_01736 [Veillonellaceae bacterium DNF00751]|nr:hypothetical protein HMPREF3033_01736 [Veillonellaceae bacterium DNF00751]
MFSGIKNKCGDTSRLQVCLVALQSLMPLHVLSIFPHDSDCLSKSCGHSIILYIFLSIKCLLYVF